MNGTIPHALPPRIQSELIDRLEDLDEQLRGIEGIFETLNLLADTFGMDERTIRSNVYYTQINAGLQSVKMATAKSDAVQALFAETG